MDALTVDRIPIEMRLVPRWCVWRNDDDAGRTTKVPYRGDTPAAIKARSNDPTSWCDFETALKRLEMGGMDGVAFFLGDGFFGVDLDSCVNPESGDVKPWAQRVIDRLASYAEISPSGTGIKITGRGRLAEIPAGKTGVAVKPKDLPKAIDFYTTDHAEIAFWHAARFWAMTGLRVGDAITLADCGPAADAILAKLRPNTKPATSYTPSEASTTVLDRCIKYLEKIDPAISGQGGHSATYHAACICFRFGLPPSDAKQAMLWFNDNKCEPHWTESQLDHKLDDALREVTSSGQFGDLVRSDSAPRNEACTSNVAIESHGPQEREPKSLTLQAAAEDYLAALDGRDHLIDLGIPELSYALGGGVELGEMVIVAARPSHGKSAVMLQVMHECARNGLEGLIVSEEMSHLALGKRAIQYITSTHQDNWQRERETVANQIKRHFSDRRPIHIVESCRTAANVEKAVERHIKEYGVKVVAVDYAQMLIGSGKSKYEQVSETSSRLKTLANKHNILLITLAQLNREIEGRNAFVPKMADLRDAGQLEQDADCIVFLVWPHRIDSKNDPHEYQLFVAKNRNRPINCPAFKVRFEPNRQRLMDAKPPNYERAFESCGQNDEELTI